MRSKFQSGILACVLAFSHGIAFADTTAPTVPADVTVSDVGANSASLNWSAAYDASGVAGYNIYRDGFYLTTVHDTRFSDSDLQSDQSYYYWLVAFDQNGNFSSTSRWAFAKTTSANTGPTQTKIPVPANVSARIQGDNSIKVTWQKPHWHRSIKGYNIYRDGHYIDTVNGTEEFTDWYRSNGSTQSYDVVAIDEWEQFSEHSSSATISWGSNSPESSTPPTDGKIRSPSNLRTSSVDSSSLTLEWDVVSSSHSIKGYNVYRNGSYVATTDLNHYTDSYLKASTEYQYQVVAFDHANNYSDYSNVFRKTTYPAPGPSKTENPVETPNGPDLTDYYLAFSDEFNQTTLDTSKWNTAYLWGPNLTTNNEEQYYVDSRNQPDFGYQPFSGNGEYMSIKASRTPEWLKPSANWKNYLSGVMTSYDSFQFTYGYAEARLRPPKGRGMFSAFWLLNARYDGITPEIDIAEFLGESPDVVYHTYHYYSQNWQLISSPSYETWTDDFTDDFHTFAVKWSPGEIIWYVDGEERKRLSHGNISSQPMYLLFNLAIGGNWPVSPDWTTIFPGALDIDYVRVYRR